MDDATKLDLNLLRVFEVIYREGSLTQAAKQLCITQPAVSHCLMRMKEQFGEPLFVRSGKGMVPTELAKRMSPDIHRALDFVRQAVNRTQGFEPERDLEEVTIAMNDVVEPVLLPSMKLALLAAAPQLNVASVRLDRANLRADLASGRLDCAIDVVRPTEQEICHRFLVEDKFVVLTPGLKSLTTKAYLAANHVTVSARASGLSVEDLELARQGLQRKVTARCQQYQTACKLVMQDHVLLTMSQQVAQAIGLPKGVTMLAPPVPLRAVRLHLYWHRSRDKEPACVWLRETLLNNLRIT